MSSLVGWQALLVILAAGLNCSVLPSHKDVNPAKAAERYTVVFHYQVKNKTKAPIADVQITIPLPQDDPGQTIESLTINDEDHLWSRTSTQDQFGQQFVRLTLPTLAAKEQKDVGFSCTFLTHPYALELRKDKCGTLSQIPQDVLRTYTGDIKDVYDINSPSIKQAAQNLASAHPNLVDRLQAIHDFVASNLTYKLDRSWSPAPEVLQRKNGSCSEYSFLFVALCRANGIPTRLVGSSHLRETFRFPYKDTAWHRWIEAYLPPYGWIPFDPTIDRGNKPGQRCSGSYDFRTLRLTHGGIESTVLGRAYVGVNNHEDQLEHKRFFIWNRLAAPIPAS